MLRFRKLGVASCAIGVLVLAFSIQLAWAQTVGTAPSARALITQSVDEGNLAALRGNTRPEATAQNDRGAVADGFPMVHLLLQLRRSPEQERALQRFLDEVPDPTSPNFHKWLRPEQFGQDFGVAQQDVDAIERWLQSHGFTVNLVYPNRMMIDFSGTAGQVREAFHTEIHNLEVNGEGHIANTRDPQIPSALAPAIVGIVSLHDFKPRAHHEMRTARANYTFNSGGINYALVPADLATIYNLNPLFSTGYSGQGQTIVIIEDTNVFSTSDWSTFRSTFGLSNYSSGSFSTSHPAPVSGPNNCADPGVTPDDIEAILDAEWASAAAPSASILLASCANTNTTFGGLIALQNLINASNQPPALVSISYGECETLNGAAANAAYNAAYQQAVSEGVSVFVSAGDSGAAGCDQNATDATDGIGVNAFASTPYNVAVGGTDFSDTYSGTNNIYWNSTNTSNFGSALSYIPEIPWNDSCASVLISTLVTGSGTTYGRNGFCNSASGGNYLTTAAGSGGPSACATGSPSVIGVVGGTCRGWPKPSWQSALNNFGNPNDGVRDTPDVSLFAANGVWLHYYVFCFSDTASGGAPCTGAPSSWAGAGGTSFASPIMAGIQALVNQKTGQRQGNPNPVYYQLAANEYNLSSSSCNSANGNSISSTCIFYDVTQGDIDVNCTGSNNCYLPSGSHGVLSTSDNSYSPAYGTTTGWDFATGIGSVNAANLVNNWPGGVVATSGTPQSTAINTPFRAPLVVTVKNASGNPVNGVTVTFTPPSSGASGNFAGGANTATTNASGVATSATFTANGTPGSYTVTASAVGITGTAGFSLTNTPGPPASITVTSGAPQSAAINMSFPAPLAVTVRDASGNPVSGVTVTLRRPVAGQVGASQAERTRPRRMHPAWPRPPHSPRMGYRAATP
jgi:subtilase family serine protease